MALFENISAVGVGQTYTTMTSWEIAKRGDLTAIAHPGYDGYIEVAEIYGGGVLTSAALDAGWTADAAHYIQVRAASGQGHEGYYSSGRACLDAGQWSVRVGYTKIGPGLSMKGTIPISCDAGLGNLTIDGCIIQFTAYGEPYGAVRLGMGGTHTVKNCVIETISSATYGPAISLHLSGTQLYVYNCTIINNLHASASGINAPGGATVTSQNNYFNTPSGRTYMGAGTINKGANDATSNTDAVTAGLRSIAYSTANFINSTLNYSDLHLSNTSALRGQGATLVDVPIDYVGNTRTGYTYDIGAHQRNTSGSDVKTFYENISAVGVGKTYTTIALWQTAKADNLVAKSHPGYDGYVEVAEIYGGGALSTSNTGAGWSTDQYHYIQMRAASGQGHEGYYNANKACLSASNWTVYVDYTKIGPGLNVQGVAYSIHGPVKNLTIDSCIFQSSSIQSGYSPIFFEGGGTHTIKNCVIDIVDASSCPAIKSNVSGTQLYVYNCTIINNLHASASGIEALTGVTVTSQNNYFNTPSGRTYMGAGTINKGANDATSNTDAVTAGLRSIAYSTANFNNVTLNSENLHLTPTSALRTKGADLYSLGITTDYEGDARHPGYLWDIGADQESDIPFCWNYTARYKNSNKLFKASGCGPFPRNLQVPGNVDTGTGKMVDDGIFINPDRYTII